jgi:signal transduction histidine kinase
VNCHRVKTGTKAQRAKAEDFFFVFALCIFVPLSLSCFVPLCLCNSVPEFWCIMEDANRKEETREALYRRELATILRSSALINSSLNIEQVLDNAMKWAEDFMGAEASTVYELEDRTNELVVRLARGEKKGPVERVTLKVGEGIAGTVVKTGKPMVIQDVSQEKKFTDKIDRLTGFQTKSAICVPLLLRNRPIGALQVINKKSGEPFNRSDLEILFAIAQHVSVAMENANLYRRLEESFAVTTQELRITQEKLIRTERLASMSNLVQGVAHEIRNPITTIGGFARRIKKELGDNRKFEKYADIILEETARLENMVKRVHDFTETQSYSPTLARIEPLVDEVLKSAMPLANQVGVRIVKQVAPDLPQVRLDSSQLAVALANIVENALESMPKGGTLSLTVLREDSSLVIAIKDTGCGIPKDQLAAVYDPFVTSKSKGVGLGLTLVHQVVSNHHGDVKIVSEVQKGTVVTLRLPLNAALRIS